MAQTRVVISDRLRPVAEELQVVTGVSSLSDVVALLLTKYAQHLKNSWVESGMQILPFKSNTPTVPQQQQVQLPEPVYEPQMQQPYYVQSLEHPTKIQELEPSPEPEIDPVIARIAGLVDVF